MAKASAVREAKAVKGKKDKSPFGSPAEDEAIELLIPEGAESGRIPAGDQYIGKLLGLVQGDSESSGNPMITWTFTMYDGDFRGMDFTMYTPLTANAMWKLADTLTALGVEWEPGVPLKIIPKELKGILVRMVIKDDKYEGRDRSKLAAVLPHPDGAGKKGKKGFIVPSKADEDEEEDFPRARKRVPREEEEDEDERPRRGRKVRDEEEEEEEEEERPARRSRSAPDMDEVWNKKGRKVKDEEEEEDDEPVARRGRPRKVVEEEEEEEETRPRKGRKARDEEEEEEEEEEPVRRRKSTKRSRL